MFDLMLAADPVEDVLEGMNMPLVTGEPDAAAVGLEPMAQHGGSVSTRWSLIYLIRVLTPTEKVALNLALMRLIAGPGAKIKDYPSFLQHGPFLSAQLATGIEKALWDLLAPMTESSIDDPMQALNLIVFEDFFPQK